MVHASLFSGIEGFALAAELIGWTTVFHCEKNKFCQQVLKYYWRDATLYTDIINTDFTPWAGKIDILSGGFPCQPYSLAGKRLGKDDERHLWPHMLRAIREIGPRWIVGENVRGIVSWNKGLVFEEVCTDLEAEGYSVQPFVLPAAGVGAPHRRERVFFIAYRSNARIESLQEQKIRVHGFDHATDANVKLRRSICRHEADRRTISQENNVDSNACSCEFTSDSSKRRLEGAQSQHYEIGREAQIQGRPQANWTKGFYSVNDFANFPTQSPVCSGDDGLPAELDNITFSKWRNESIKAFGNAVVPKLVLQILNAIDLYEMLY